MKMNKIFEITFFRRIFVFKSSINWIVFLVSEEFWAKRFFYAENSKIRKFERNQKFWPNTPNCNFFVKIFLLSLKNKKINKVLTLKYFQFFLRRMKYGQKKKKILTGREKKEKKKFLQRREGKIKIEMREK